MNYWNILGIKPNADKKAIKIAYSKLLKNTRPDDDPAGFERLHSAYKSALAEVDRSNSVSTQDHDYDTPEDLESTLIDSPAYTDSIVPLEPKPDVEGENNFHASDKLAPESVDNELEKEWSHFKSLVDEIMRNQQSANTTDSWETVVSSPLMTDLRFKEITRDYVFDVISQRNVISLENNELYIDSNTLNHLNSHFSWNLNWTQLDDNFSDTRLDSILPFLNEEKAHETPQEIRPHALSRIVGYFTGLLAIIAGYLHLPFLITVTLFAIPLTINRIYTRKWQTENYGRVIGAEDELIEQNKYVLYFTLFFSMCLVLSIEYGIGWTINYLIQLI